MAAPKRERGKRKNMSRPSHLRRAEENRKLEELQKLVQDFECPLGETAFSSLPISAPTKRGLKAAYYENMTDIQTRSIPISLKGQDVLGCARTGSGKTLAFLVPVLELLYRRKWGTQDGLGALIISPTRELAIQIFDVLRRIGGYHSFSAGLVIGGKNLKDERDRLGRMNILVATPGRLLQHMDQTVGFEVQNLQILVLDEADRILDMGFSRTLDAIVGHLPRNRQTLLFSATQTQTVKELARLSLDNPNYISAQEAGSDLVTPRNLEQHYLVSELDKKLDVLYSFIRTHLKAKAIVFMSSGKQVRFVYETFCQLQPGIPLLLLHGKQKQTKRLAIYRRFLTASHSILFATDIAARGLDFPAIDWVIQLDAPEDAETYIHRVGRTARYESAGRSLLFLLPSEEEGMIKALTAKGVQIEKIKPKQSKIASITQQLQNFAFKDPEIKYLGQRAFVSYMKSIYLQKDKSIFKLEDLPADKFAASLGLPGTPKIKFLKEVAQKKNVPRTIPIALESEQTTDEDMSSTEEESENEKTQKVRTKYDRMFERKNQNILSQHYAKLINHNDDLLAEGEQDEDFITLKRADHTLEDNDTSALKTSNIHGAPSKRKLKEALSRKATLKYKETGRKLVFDEEGRPHELYEMKDDFAFHASNPLEAGKSFAENERNRLMEVDARDKEEAREKKREKKRKRKQREREESGDGVGALLNPLSDEGYESPGLDLPDLLAGEQSEKQSSSIRPFKRNKLEHRLDSMNNSKLEAEEELALKMLSSRQNLL